LQPSILIIDDDQDILEALRIILEGESYKVRVALDGQQGLKAIEEEKPDLIILDLLLPGKDGVSVCGSLKTRPEYRNIPVIVLTALTKKMGDKIFTQREEKVLREVDGYLDKPVNPQELLIKVRELLEREKDEKTRG